MKVSIWISMVFIILCVLTMSFFTLLLKRAIANSPLPEEKKFSYAFRIGMLGRLWILVTAVLGLLEVFEDFTVPPKIILATLPPFLVVLWLARSQFTVSILPGLSIMTVYFLQFFRVIVELELHELWKAGLLPQSMTFEGRNFDIAVGLSAPIIGWLVYKSKSIPEQFALYWNIWGVLVLTNVVVTGILSTPTPFRVFVEDYPNLAIGYFPFTWLPTLLVPIAYALHVLAIRYYLWPKNSK
jgi:hypothetical protein